VNNPRQFITRFRTYLTPDYFSANRRRIGTVASIGFALLLAWHVVNGQNGLSNWCQKRAEDRALTKEIADLTAENAHLAQHVERLKSDPGTIEHEARDRFGYARPNEKIFPLSRVERRSDFPQNR
jgi:cell division protein FtsB